MIEQSPIAMVQVAMVNDHHFWGLQQMHVDVPVVQPSDGDMIAVPVGESKQRDDEEAIATMPLQTIVPDKPMMAEEDVSRELDLCQCLLEWDAFGPPSDAMVEAGWCLYSENLLR